MSWELELQGNGVVVKLDGKELYEISEEGEIRRADGEGWRSGRFDYGLDLDDTPEMCGEYCEICGTAENVLEVDGYLREVHGYRHLCYAHLEDHEDAMEMEMEL
jgi:hypothetical protein